MAIAEMITGLGLLLDPSLVAWLLLGRDLESVGAIAGIALLGLGVAAGRGRRCCSLAWSGST
jgi:hypothetical protein